MTRYAKQPLSEEACRAADEDIYAAHANDPRPNALYDADGNRRPLDPNDPSQAALRTEWMDLYIAHGGEASSGTPGPGVDDPVERCPWCDESHLTVVVLDQTTGLPIADARVTVSGPSPSSGMTDAAGLLEVGVVEAGSYEVQAEHDDYSSGTDYATVGKGESVLIELRLVNQTRPVVFLTFDDGVQLGTQEVYDTLKAQGVRATFFLTGAHVVDYESRYSSGLVRRIYSDPDMDVANHSNSHANQFYSSFYSKGLLLKDGTTRRSVVDDFGLCDQNVSHHAGLPATQRLRFARFPGRNTWRARGINITDRDNGGDTEDEANTLSGLGYQVYGWDDEFGVSEDGDPGDGTSRHSDYDPDVDVGNPADFRKGYQIDVDLDRPTESAAAVVARIKSKFTSWYRGPQKKDKLILLMHDRMFRTHGSSNPARYTDVLAELVQLLKREGYGMDKMSNY